MSGLGISYFSALTVRRELREKRLVRLPIRSLMLPRCFLFIHRRDKRLTPALGASGTSCATSPAAGSEAAVPTPRPAGGIRSEFYRRALNR